MPPKPLPGLSFEQIDSSAQIEPSKKRKTAESANVNTIAKRPKPDELATGNPAHDASRLAAVTDDLNTVISGLTELFSTMKLLLGRGNFSDVEELATQAPDFLKRLQILLSMQSNQFRKIMQRGRKFEEEAAEREKLRTDVRFSFPAALAGKSGHILLANKHRGREVSASNWLLVKLQKESARQGWKFSFAMSVVLRSSAQCSTTMRLQSASPPLRNVMKPS